MIYVLLFLALATLSRWFWRAKYIPSQVASNLAAFDADGASDTLQRGYHSRETWRRLWVGLACCVVPSLSFSFSNLTSCLLSFVAMAALLAGEFARYFTPWLNLARHATRPDITEWYASPASKSFPDAGAWKLARQAPAEMLAADRQEYADHLLQQMILSTYRWCLAVALLLAGAAVYFAVK